MSEIDQERERPDDWKAYLSGIQASGEVLKWIWNKIIPEESKKESRQILKVWPVIIGLGIAQSWLTSRVLDAGMAHTKQGVISAFFVLVMAMIIQRWLRYNHSIRREKIFHLNSSIRSSRLTDLFLEKSMGQHLREGSRLSVPNMEKGWGSIVYLEELILFEVVTFMFQLLFSFLFLWFVSPVVGLIMTLLLIGHVVIGIFLNHRVLCDYTPIEEEERKVTRYRGDRWEKVERVKSSGRESTEVSYIKARLTETNSRGFSFWAWFCKVTWWRDNANAFILPIVLGYSVWQAWHGSLTWGLLLPIYSWTQQIADNLWHISQYERQLSFHTTNVRAMMQSLTMPPDMVDEPNAIDVPADVPLKVQVAGVSYRYSADGHDVLKDITFSMEEGDRVAIIGESGVGKTTLFRLFLKYMQPTSGAILVNGVDLRFYRNTSWIASLGYIAQEAQIFDGTVRSNLLYGVAPEQRSSITDEYIGSLMDKLQLDLRYRLKDGLDTVVGRHGMKLSGGEKQRLLICSIVLRKPRILVVDEATSGLDFSKERNIYEQLFEILPKDVILLMITHRLTTVQYHCTKFVVLKSSHFVDDDDSQVETIGSSFRELWNFSPTFRRLAADQGIVFENAYNPQKEMYKELYTVNT